MTGQLCVVCSRREPWRREDGTVPLVCGVCLSRVSSMLRDIPRYAAELARQLVDAAMPDPNGKDVSILLPSASLSSSSRTGRVSGTPEPHLPINGDREDLLGPWKPSLMAEPVVRLAREIGDAPCAEKLRSAPFRGSFLCNRLDSVFAVFVE